MDARISATSRENAPGERHTHSGQRVQSEVLMTEETRGRKLKTFYALRNELFGPQNKFVASGVRKTIRKTIEVTGDSAWVDHVCSPMASLVSPEHPVWSA